MKGINTTKLMFASFIEGANNRLSNPMWLTYMRKLPLARLLSITLLMFLCVSCGKSEEKRTTSKNKRSSSALRQKFFDAKKQMEEFAAEKNLMSDSRIANSKAQFFEAHQAVTKMRKAHPDLMPIYEKSEALQDQAIKFRLAQDEAAYQQSMKEYKTIRTQLEHAANKLPEIIEAQKQVTLAREEQTSVLCEVVAESGATGKKLADNVRTLLEQIQASRD